MWARGLVDTDDLVQDSLLQTFQERSRHSRRRYAGGLQAYLRQAVLNRLRDELRRRQREPRFEAVEAVGLEADGSPLETAIGREELARYEAALERLRPEDREAIVARIEMGYDYVELAEALGSRAPTPPARRRSGRSCVLPRSCAVGWLTPSWMSSRRPSPTVWPSTGRRPPRAPMPPPAPS